jgi:hypothetical protein
MSKKSFHAEFCNGVLKVREKVAAVFPELGSQESLGVEARAWNAGFFQRRGGQLNGFVDFHLIEAWCQLLLKNTCSARALERRRPSKELSFVGPRLPRQIQRPN